jgi:hypothetical protein
MGRSLIYRLSTLVVAMLASACATLQPTSPNGPRSDAKPYPVAFSSEPGRMDEVRVAWRQLAQRFGVAGGDEPHFNPITDTIDGLPPRLGTSIFLPRVGAGPAQSEEDTRESLRRFIDDWEELIGAESSQLSLIERSDDASGIRIARYEQRPFRYPLRGGFGNLVIRFRNDRQLIDLSSNCLPNAGRVQSSIANLSPQVGWDDAASLIKGQPIVVTDGAGRQKSFTLTPGEKVEVRQLVVFAVPSKEQKNALDVHLAWEIRVPDGPVTTLYLDAISGQVIAGS